MSAARWISTVTGTNLDSISNIRLYLPSTLESQIPIRATIHLLEQSVPNITATVSSLYLPGSIPRERETEKNVGEE